MWLRMTQLMTIAVTLAFFNDNLSFFIKACEKNELLRGIFFQNGGEYKAAECSFGSRWHQKSDEKAQ